MSCNTCQVKYTFFTRENACPSCGFSYCSKCLKYKYNIPDIGMKKICGKCYFRIKDEPTAKNIAEDILDTPNPQVSSSEEKNMERVIAPVDITKKLDLLEDPARPPIVMYKQGSRRWDKLKSGLDLEDQKIVDRLKKLKNEDKPIPQPSIEEIRRRLALLKDQDPNKPVMKTNIHEVDARTDEEKTADLINEYLEELQLSSDEHSDSNIEDRLARLRGIDPEKFSKNRPEEDEDEQAATAKIIKKALAEAALESKYSELDDLEPMDTDAAIGNTPEDEELPWCIICNENAQLRCLGCDGDLYCASCFRQGHDSFEMVDHQSEPFKLQQKPTKD